MAEYIERDFTVSKLKEHLRKYPDACYSVAEIILILNEVPTADVVEIKHGEWIESDYCLEIIYQCSACKEDFVLIEGTPEENLWKYCPNCGAKMDKKEGAEG